LLAGALHRSSSWSWTCEWPAERLPQLGRQAVRTQRRVRLREFLLRQRSPVWPSRCSRCQANHPHHYHHHHPLFTHISSPTSSYVAAVCRLSLKTLALPRRRGERRFTHTHAITMQCKCGKLYSDVCPVVGCADREDALLATKRQLAEAQHDLKKACEFISALSLPSADTMTSCTHTSHLLH
jgi:hypothetical protein